MCQHRVQCGQHKLRLFIGLRGFSDKGIFLKHIFKKYCYFKAFGKLLSA